MNSSKKGKGKASGKRGKGKGEGGGGGGKPNKSQARGCKKDCDKNWDYDFALCGGTKDVPSSVNKESGQKRQKSTMQTLNMTSENQKRVKELLRDLQGQDLTAGSEMPGLDDHDSDESDYLDDDDQCLFESKSIPKMSMTVFSQAPVNHILEDEVSSFAVHKLSRYGFDTERCRAVLKSYHGNIGASLEYLLFQCFSEKFAKRMQITETVAQASTENCLEQRREEAFALHSICGDKFVERITNRVWTIMLNLTHLTEILSKSKTPSGGLKPASQEICQHYLRGDCKFGWRCKFKHEPSHKQKTLPSVKEDAHLKLNAPVYELEIRFPEDNKYPYQAPLVAFYSTNENLPLACRLHVAEFLYEKALIASKSCEPVVYSFITCLEDEEEVKKLFSKTFHKYSVPLVPLMTSSATRPANVDEHGLPKYSTFPSHISEAMEELVIEDEEDDVQTVHTETESYVNLRERLLKKYSRPANSACKDSSKFCRQFNIKKSSKRFQAMLQERQNLPVWEKRGTILRLLKKHQVLVVSGMTGCGKTTQIPQFILESTFEGHSSNLANIICTQPRRISAISVAERVAKEQTERVGVTVGYQIRLESVKSSATRLLYCTTGVLLRRLEGDMNLQGVTHVIVDEVHERTEESDFLLLVLKHIISQRSDLHIILMSATLDTDLFSQYFNCCPVVTIPGFLQYQLRIRNSTSTSDYACTTPTE